MKRVVAAVILLSFAVGLSAWSEITYRKHMSSFEYDIENIISLCDNSTENKIIDLTEKTAEKWHKYDDLLHSLVVHEGMDELEEAMIKVIVGPQKKSKVISDKSKKLTAYHEAGHAVASYYLKNHDEVHHILSFLQAVQADTPCISPKKTEIICQRPKWKKILFPSSAEELLKN